MIFLDTNYINGLIIKEIHIMIFQGILNPFWRRKQKQQTSLF